MPEKNNFFGGEPSEEASDYYKRQEEKRKKIGQRFEELHRSYRDNPGGFKEANYRYLSDFIKKQGIKPGDGVTVEYMNEEWQPEEAPNFFQEAFTETTDEFVEINPEGIALHTPGVEISPGVYSPGDDVDVIIPIETIRDIHRWMDVS